MPELPEVETICQLLRNGTRERLALPGMRITHAMVLWPRSIFYPDVELFLSQISNRKIEVINRRGKYLVISLDADFYLLIHLRMSGDLWVEPQVEEFAKHHRVIFFLENEFRLAFNDARKFGRVWLTQNPLDILSGLGPEPLDEFLKPQEFFTRLQQHSRQLKPLLLDQSFIAGLGNIYTDEGLFMAGLHPLTPANQVTYDQAGELLESIRFVLREGIRRNGASIDWVYRGGDFQNYFKVYQRDGETCYRCGSKILRMVVGQRGTHYCPKCQPEPGASL